MGLWGYGYADNDLVLDELNLLINPAIDVLNEKLTMYNLYSDDYNGYTQAMDFFGLRGLAVAVMKMVDSLDANYFLSVHDVEVFLEIIQVCEKRIDLFQGDENSIAEFEHAVGKDIIEMTKWVNEHAKWNQ